MSKELHHIISKLRAESSLFNTNDVLVNAQKDHRGLHFIDRLSTFESESYRLDEFPKKILANSQANKKESGVNTLCVARGILYLELNGREIHTPILLTPISAKIDRVQQTVKFQEIDDSTFINPFISGHFLNKLESSIPTDVLSSNELGAIVSYFESLNLNVDSDVSVIGNFHHHRYQVLKELDDLSEVQELNPAIGALFGEIKANESESESESESDSDQTEEKPINTESTNLFPADTDHELVFNAVSTSHAVVQGPPGTGKSQVICNLIGKALHSNQTILAVSEKRAALEVIESKLGEFELDLLSFVAGSNRQSHDFLGSLKQTWDFFESYTSSTDINLQLSDQYEDHLQMTLDMLNQSDLIGGVSFHEFQDLSKGKNIDNSYSSVAPSIAKLVENKECVQQLFQLGLTHNLSFFRKKTIESVDFLTLDQRIKAWQELLNSLQLVFKLDTWNELSLAMNQAATCQIFENELFKKYSAIFTPESKEQKQFQRLAKQYVALSDTTEVGSEWKIYPSLIEALSIQSQLRYGKFFKKRSAKKRWKEISNLPFTEASENIEKRIKFGEQEGKLVKCISQLKKLGIHNPETEVELIQASISSFSKERWEIYSAFPPEHRSKTTLHHKALNDLYHDISSTFKILGETNISALLSKISEQFSIILSERKNILHLNEHELESLRSCKTYHSYEALVLGSNYTVFKERFPAFSNFDPKAIKEKVNFILDAHSFEAKIHARQLLNSVHTTFTDFHFLLNTPVTRLNAEQKTLKKELRKGKSLLIKEFRKTRSHPTLRELFASEARHWISLLKPIWLSNPSSLANCFPMEQNCFDLVIFDEASQIPIQHALGAIQRSKRIVVAGDEHQMGPSNYFQAGSNEVTDLLHQASYYLPKVPLLHHYRSVHPELIAFSNKHFYGGKLTAYPSAQSLSRPIKTHYIKNAVFQDRVNELEASAIASHISTQLNQTKSIGIVAFSEDQLSCIWKKLDPKTQEKLLIHQETNGGFFKALENVQGDECDALIIGFGYARNETGDFNLRFGPMNTENGRKRLNVLLTRSRESIDFFCSVKSSDFKLSDNESINLLRQWIAFAETERELDAIKFPHGLKPKIEGNTLTFDRIQSTLPNAREVATLQSVLENRGWIVSYA